MEITIPMVTVIGLMGDARQKTDALIDVKS